MLEKDFDIYYSNRISNKLKLTNVKYCGCDNCGTLYNPNLITDWIDEGNNKYTAKCPFCYCDDVIPLGNIKDKCILLHKDIMAHSRNIDVAEVDVNVYEQPLNNKGNLKVRIIKGANQIGGCITEIESNKARIIIDFGEDLDDLKNNVDDIPQIEGLTYGKPKYDAVFITHSHIDHIGLINYILPEIPVYVEEKSQMIYELTCDFLGKDCKRDTNIVWYNNWYDEYGYIPIKDIKVKYYKVDHSAYNSSMILIECGDKKILHTGDFRNHGYKGSEFIPTLQRIIKENGKVDLLITEGTCFNRKGGKNKSEAQLSNEATELFKKYNQVFLLQSSTNIDRITSFFKASVKTGKKFIEDAFTANITLNIGNNIPNPNFSNNKISVWIPQAYNDKLEDFKEKYLIPLEKYKRVENVYKDYTLMVKTSMYDDIKLLYDKGKVTNACIVYSMWDGYLNKPKMQEFVNKVKALGIDFVKLHTSGHADLETIKVVDKIIQPTKVIVIHTQNCKKAKEVFENTEIIDDGMCIEI